MRIALASTGAPMQSVCQRATVPKFCYANTVVGGGAAMEKWRSRFRQFAEDVEKHHLPD
jgi:hypothetical protein